MSNVKIRFAIILSVTLCLATLEILTLTALAQESPKVTKEEVLGMLGNPDVIIIDVRSRGGELKIKGAVREDPKNVSSWIDQYPKDKLLVFY